MSEEDLQQFVVSGVQRNLPIIPEGLQSAISFLDNQVELIPSKNPGIFMVTGAASNGNDSLLSNNLIFLNGAIEP
jgi:hypothetical protein